MAITPTDFTYICDLVRRRSGIVLETGKEYLVEARVSSILRPEGIESIAAVVKKLQADPAGPLSRRVVEVMTTNETSFFRDIHPFEMLRKTVLPALIKARESTRALNIWCAASSTGQEPYTLAMILREHFPVLATWNVTFIATDLSSEMVAKSKAGKYGQIEVNRGLPAVLMVKYFQKNGMEWQVDQGLRSMIDFREMNLTTPWPGLPPLDLVFMRNVLIYFDTQTKREILGRVRRLLRPDAALFLGCAETTMSIDDGFERVQADNSSYYRLRAATMAAAA